MHLKDRQLDFLKDTKEAKQKKLQLSNEEWFVTTEARDTSRVQCSGCPPLERATKLSSALQFPSSPVQTCAEFHTLMTQPLQIPGVTMDESANTSLSWMPTSHPAIMALSSAGQNAPAGSCLACQVPFVQSIIQLIGCPAHCSPPLMVTPCFPP